MPSLLSAHGISAGDPPRRFSSKPLGCMQELRDEPLAFFTELHARHGDIARFRIAHINCYALRDPAAIHHVLVDAAARYGKQTLGYEKLRLFLGNGLVTAEGASWRRHRRIAQPIFHRERVRAFGETMREMSDELTESWRRQLPDGGVLDLHREMMKVTLRIIASTVLSIDVQARESEVGDAISTLLEVFNDSLHRLFPIHERLPTRTNRRWEAARNYLDQIVYEIIEQRRREASGEASGVRTAEGPGDLLDMLLEARDEESGTGMSDLQARDEVMTMFTAGHETTANALAFSLYELARHPDIAAELQAELDAVIGDGPPTLEQLPHLPLCAAVIDEAMRLHPPAWVIARSLDEDDEIAGYRLRGGSIVFFSPFAVHRHPRLWPEPERFDPSRFDPSRVERADAPTRPRYAYFPFSGGPRVCIGKHFALMEARIVLATIASRFDLALVPGHELRYDPSVTLRPRGGLPLRLSPRRG